MKINSFTSGLVQDVMPSTQPEGSLSYARNIVQRNDKHKYYGVSPERSDKQVLDTGGDIKGTTYVEELDSTIVFLQDGSSSLWLFNHTTYDFTHIVSDSEFGCNWGFKDCEKLYAEVKFHNACNDLMVYFSADCVYYVVNLTEMLDPVRKSAAIECRDCTYFTIFDPICRPKLQAIPIPYSGSTTIGGAVSFAVRLSDQDGNESNWFAASNTVFLGTENNQPGEPATNGARLIVDNLNNSYGIITVAAIKTSAGVTTAELLPPQSYSGATYSFDYFGQKGEAVNPVTVTTITKQNIKGTDLLQHDGRMLFYNIKPTKNLNYQKHANNIDMECVVYRTSMEVNLKYSFPSFMRGEVYDFGIVWNYEDGTHSAAFHIPACGGAKSSGGIDTPNNYVDIASGTFDTNDRFLRKRNPDGGSENADAMEDAVENDISNIDTTTQTIVDGSVCLDCPPTTTSLSNDLPDYSNTVENQFEQLSQYGLDRRPENIELNQTPSLKDAALKLMDEGVRKREFVEQKRVDFVPPQTPTVGSATSSVKKDYRFSEDRNDPWTDVPNRRELTEGLFFEPGVLPLDPVVSSISYPDTKDCDGNRLYPDGNICHHKFPDVSSVPHSSGLMNGVVTKYTPGNYEYNSHVQLLGIRAKNIIFPSADELPKPLCSQNPYTIVYVKRTSQNKTVLAAGWTSGVFTGQAGGSTYCFPRHGVNSFEHVDRSIAPSSNPKSRMGEQYTDGGLYTFHSPDTDLSQPFLGATHFRNGLKLQGGGWRHGLYAMGRPPSDVEAGSRKDQRGARVSNNLNHFQPSSGSEVAVNGITYVPANTVLTNSDSFRLSLMNKYRESSVFLDVEGEIEGNDMDTSFVGDVLDHEAPTRCNAGYGYLIRELNDQYGSIEGRAYISTGVHGFGTSTSVSGISGDIFIVPYSKRRTSFVSNKIGNTFNIRPKPLSEPRPRTVCDSPDDQLFSFLGFNANALKHPESGDFYDPKNYCGLHTVNDTLSRQWEPAANAGISESDYYYPGVLKSLVHCVVESEVNAWYRATGEGEQVNTGRVFYPKLKDLYLDSAAPDNHPWEEAYLNRFYVPDNQPSQSQINRIAAIRSFLQLIVPAAMLTELNDIDGVIDAIATMFTSGGISALWMLAAHTVFTVERVRNLFGIEGCLTDDEGGDLRMKIEGFEDNYNYYNYDYSTLSTYPTYYTYTSLVNLCDCDDCDEHNLEIYYSNKQNLDSEIDAYQNVGLNQYVELPPHAGYLKRLFIQQNNVYAHTSKGIWLMQFGIGNIPSDIGSLLTGDGQLLLNPILLMDSGTNNEGIAGTYSPNSAINVPGEGYFFIDERAGKVYRFNGQLEDISRYGNEIFFRNLLQFCEKEECYDEETGNRFVLSWDNINDRLLLTKHDGKYSFTFSFTKSGADGNPQWISFHDYIPDGSFWDRRHLFLYKDNTIYLNGGGSDYLTYFGEKYDMVIQGVFTEQALKYFELKRVSIASFVINENGIIQDEIFNQGAFFSGRMSTGLRTIIPILETDRTNSSQNMLSRDGTSSFIAYHNLEEWDISNMFNLLDNDCSTGLSPIIIKEDCNVHPVIPNGGSCLPLRSQEYYNRNFGGRYIRFHLIYSGDKELIVNYIGWESAPVQHKVYS